MSTVPEQTDVSRAYDCYALAGEILADIEDTCAFKPDNEQLQDFHEAITEAVEWLQITAPLLQHISEGTAQ